jgi:hypothetical protein
MNPGLAEGGIMQTPNIDHTATRSKRNRRMVTLGAGALALVLAIIATVAAVGRGSSSAAQAHQPATTVASPATIASQSSSDQVASVPAKKAKSVSAPSTPAAPVLADGTYPTYVTKVDVGGATITVDVIQVFQNEAAVKAAIEDGMTRDEAQMLYIYVRNQNPLLRTLGVAGNVRIVFLDGCEAPDRTTGLTELAKVTKHFDSLYYYDITVTNGVIHQILQRIAEAAC